MHEGPLRRRATIVRERGVRFPRHGHGRVFSAHERALNLAMDGSSELVTLVCDAPMMTVSSLLLASDGESLRFARMQRGTEATVTNATIGFATGLLLELREEHAASFTGIPRRWDPGPAARKASDASRARELLLRSIVDLGRDAGFAPLAAGLLALGETAGTGSLPADAGPFARAAWAALGCGSGDGSVGWEDALARVIGLGQGFTPSGDDFVVGALAARAVRGLPAPGPRAGGVLRDRCAATTLPGATIVGQAVDGHYPAYLCDFAGEFGEAVASGGASEEAAAVDVASLRAAVDRAVARAAAHGHSSGIDALTGFAFAL